ncbi:unnamed protein product [Orchesella dallaii]|uniref:Histidine phosphatase family protein n=1 Tax=Orchesella dallaii TaxID=48710 RepID=A0ABP1RAJ9_9HEXA
MFKLNVSIIFLLLLSELDTLSQTIDSPPKEPAMSGLQAIRNFTVTFVRHGQTKANAGKIIQSRSQGELSELGIKMAQALGSYWKDETFTRAYTSDLKRCEDTMTNILKNIKNPPTHLILNPILRERDYGELENQPTQRILDIHAIHGGRKNAIPIPGSEPYELVLERTGKFFNELCGMADKSNSNQNILVVTHSSWIGTLLDWLVANSGTFQLLNYDDEKRWLAPKNTATTSIVIHKKSGNDDKRKVEFLRIHDFAHLIAAGITPP